MTNEDQKIEDKQFEKEMGIIFLHGYESSGQGFKGRFFRKIFPNIETPTMKGDLFERLKQIHPIIDGKKGWIIIGSSYGGLMGTMLASSQPKKILKLILLAPALKKPYIPKELENLTEKIGIPTVFIHGKNDQVISVEEAEKFVENNFSKISIILKEDDHFLHHTVQNLDWKELIKV